MAKTLRRRAARPAARPTAAPKTKAADIVKVAAAKGRPMLTWVGKRPLRSVTAFPAQEAERFAIQGPVAEIDWSDWPEKYPRRGLLFHGDNKEVLAHLLANGFRGNVDLIYIDPPFDSGADYVRRVQLRGVGGTAQLDGQGYTLGEQLQYTDIWANDNYLQFMYERLQLLRELLAPDGSLWLHVDVHRVHHLRAVLEEVFGPANFRNEIVWQRFNFRADGRKFGTVHDSLLLVTKGDEYQFDKPYVDLSPSYIRTHFRPDDSGRMYRLDNLTAPAHGKLGKPLKFGDTVVSPPAGTMWRFAQDALAKAWDEGRIVIPDGGVPQVKRYLDEIQGQAVHSIWSDISSINSQSSERTDFPTQKPESLLERILATSSVPGDIVLDAFIGSGTTAVVAQRMGRRWIGCDINSAAIQTTAKGLMEELRPTEWESGQSELLPETIPAQQGFVTYRVNNYDLQVRHEETRRLVAEHLGMTLTPADRFFDGTLAKKLVKIVPFDHAIGPVDLDEVANEIKARPKEERDLVVVGIGKELACDPWLRDHNRRGAPNQIQLIELRSDPKYGKFFTHLPPKAKISVQRSGSDVVVEIKDFISPTIIERLTAQEGLVAPKITDWRSMVDSVMIDLDYDGKSFDVAHADVPETKDDLVAGTYRLPLKRAGRKATVAVKITDMLGEELLITADI